VDEDSFVIEFAWSVDDVDQDNIFRNFTYGPGFNDAGLHVVTVAISDEQTTVRWSWDVTVNDTNRPPVLISMSPENGSKFKEGKGVNLAAVIDDPDGDLLSFEWREGIDLIGKGSIIQPSINHTFPPGKHTVRLSVSDPKGLTVTGQVSFEVTEAEDGAMDWAVLAVGAIVAIVIAFVLYAYMPRRAQEEDIEKALDEEERVRKGKVTKGKGRKKGGRKGKGRGKRKKRKEGAKKKVVEDEALDDEVKREMKAERKRMAKRRKRRAR
jgi:hypothetical protein